MGTSNATFYALVSCGVGLKLTEPCCVDGPDFNGLASANLASTYAYASISEFDICSASFKELLSSNSAVLLCGSSYPDIQVKDISA